MKKYLYVGTIALVALLSSCAAPLFFQQPYTTVEQIMSLKPGMTISEVNRTLDISPIEMLEMNNEGKIILKYRYKTAGYLVKDKYAGLPGSSGYSDQPVYSNEGELFVHFQDGKLISVQSNIFDTKGSESGNGERKSLLERLF